jgi:hypothetical protein
MVCCGLPTARGVGHHAPSIRLGDLDSSIALSLESHGHLLISIIDSFGGEFPAVLLVSSFCDPSLRSAPHRLPAYPAETTVVKRFQFRPVFFFQSPAFASPECYIDNNHCIEPATDVHPNLFVAEHLPVHRVE